jgi:hypothetical protein
MITVTKTTHKTQDTIPKCDTCGALATHGCLDCREINHVPSDGYRYFEATKLKRGCASHPVIAYTTYSDGRLLRTDECVPERILCQ